MTNVYLDEFSRVGRTAFSMWNREPASPSFGSFDRQYWGWKYKDFSDATMQYGVKLAVEYAKQRGHVAALPDWLDAYVGFCERIQLRDGSFDQAYPHEGTPGVVYDILSTLIFVRNSSNLTRPNSRDRLDAIIERAVSFALKTDEKHGEVANHIAQYAYELFNYAKMAGAQKVNAKAHQYLRRLLSLFDAEEGWFLEYDGADPGYQTRTLRYLVKIARLLDDRELWDVAKKAAIFVEQVLMPDGSLHPMLGCRSTALVYPSAFEALAIHDGNFRRVAATIRQGWSNRRVPLPSMIDFGNAIRLADDAFDAGMLLIAHPPTVVESGLPTKDCNFARAGIAIRRQSDQVIYVGYKLGGVVVAYEKDDAGWKLICEDSGYLLKSVESTEVWLSRMSGSGVLTGAAEGSFTIKAGFYRSLHDELTPLRLCILRLLNMTLLRFQWSADLFRKLVVKRLMSGTSLVPLALERSVFITEKKITISDHVVDRRGKLDSARESLWRCRRIVGTHMASSRYFQEQEIESVSGWTEKLPWPATRQPYVSEIAFREK